jgi:hypothetical protein
MPWSLIRCASKTTVRGERQSSSEVAATSL